MPVYNMDYFSLLLLYKKKLYKNYIIYTSSEFQDKWNFKEINYCSQINIKEFFKQLVEEINNVNKCLLKSLFNFAERRDMTYLCNLIYEKDKNKFSNPFIDEKKEFNFIKSSVFTPPNNFLENYWTNYIKPFKNLDELIDT